MLGRERQSIFTPWGGFHFPRQFNRLSLHAYGHGQSLPPESSGQAPASGLHGRGGLAVPVPCPARRAAAPQVKTLEALPSPQTPQRRGADRRVMRTLMRKTIFQHESPGRRGHRGQAAGGARGRSDGRTAEKKRAVPRPRRAAAPPRAPDLPCTRSWLLGRGHAQKTGLLPAGRSHHLTP